MLKNEEKNTIQKLDELSLYLNINKYQTLLTTLNQETLENVVDEELVKEKESELKNKLNESLQSVLRFGIDPTDEENLKTWMIACSTYIKNLDMLEHTMFFYKKNEGNNLGLFGTSSYGESTILKSK